MSWFNRQMERRPLRVWLLIGAITVIATGWALGVLIEDVIGSNGLERIDGPVMRFMRAHTTAWLTDVARVVTTFGRTLVVVAFAAAFAGWLASRRRAQDAALLVITVLGATTTNAIIKAIVRRPRPALAYLTDTSGWSFPSGHTAGTTALCLAVAVILSRSTTSWRTRVCVWGPAAALIVLVGASRIYLRVHYPTDVAGGVVIGAMWVAIASRGTARVAVLQRRPRLRETR